jgi:hypothetical protein
LPNTPILGLPYPAATDAPDGPGAIYALETTLENGPLNQSGWSPGLGGTGVAVGTSGSTDGYVVRLGKRVSYHGRILFGTSASLGTGTPAVTGLNSYGNLDVRYAIGRGWYHPVSGAPTSLLLVPQNGSQFLVLIGSTGASAGSITPAQNDQLHFVVDGILA